MRFLKKKSSRFDVTKVFTAAYVQYIKTVRIGNGKYHRSPPHTHSLTHTHIPMDPHDNNSRPRRTDRPPAVAGPSSTPLLRGLSRLGLSRPSSRSNSPESEAPLVRLPDREDHLYKRTENETTFQLSEAAKRHIMLPRALSAPVLTTPPDAPPPSPAPVLFNPLPPLPDREDPVDKRVGCALLYQISAAMEEDKPNSEKCADFRRRFLNGQMQKLDFTALREDFQAAGDTDHAKLAIFAASRAVLGKRHKDRRATTGNIPARAPAPLVATTPREDATSIVHMGPSPHPDVASPPRAERHTAGLLETNEALKMKSLLTILSRPKKEAGPSNAGPAPVPMPTLEDDSVEYVPETDEEILPLERSNYRDRS